MKIIGRLIKKTTEIGFKRINRKQLSYQHQLNTLTELLGKAQHTEFGFFYDFKTLLKSKDSVSKFQSHIPIMDYEEFHTRWLQHTIAGKSDCTWPGKIKYFALSSGTTGSPSKRIPVSIEMIRSFQRSSIRQYAILHALDLNEEFFSASGLAVGGSSKLKKIGNRYEGDLSGILKKHTSIFVKPITKPSNTISAIPDWNDKLNAMVEKAPQWNIGIVAGIPSWCIMLMERIIDRYKLETIHDIWPNFRVYVHGGVYMDPYVGRLEKICSKEVYLLDTYLASEGYFAFQTSPNEKGMKLLMNNGIFFEFIPFDSRFFNEEGELISTHKALTVSEVKEGVDYALVISTNAGLWRYLIGDLVRFIDVREHRLIISGRIKQFLSLCGEHLSLDNINQALNMINTPKRLLEPEFTIFVDKTQQLHHWFVELVDESTNPEAILAALDKQLSALNDDYYSARKYNLKGPQITCLPKGTIYSYMKSLQKLGAQNKMPRVLNDAQASLWFEFLSENGIN
ncbi:MAG: GH3 auxin-responsive promoter family protein [Flavobacteriales bacterium]|jgi:phenylacetate-coenzyme A ligase PaaK-like adenylate-forming protein